MTHDRGQPDALRPAVSKPAKKQNKTLKSLGFYVPEARALSCRQQDCWPAHMLFDRPLDAATMIDETYA